MSTDAGTALPIDRGSARSIDADGHPEPGLRRLLGVRRWLQFGMCVAAVVVVVYAILGR